MFNRFLNLILITGFALKNYRQKSRCSVYRSFAAKTVLRISTRGKLINRLKSDRNLKKLCGFMRIKDIPSEATFSRVFSEFSELEVNQNVHECMIKENMSDILVGHISRDSTAIAAREKPVDKKKDVKKKAVKEKKNTGSTLAIGLRRTKAPSRFTDIEA